MGAGLRNLTAFFLLLNLIPVAAQSVSVTSEGYIRSWKDSDGHVVYSGESGRITSVATADEERLVLRKYDDLSRIVQEIVWNSDYSLIISETLYTYLPSQTDPESRTVTLPEQKTREKVLYDRAGAEKERFTWTIPETGDDLLTSRQVYGYDSRHRLISDLTETYDADGAAVLHTVELKYAYTDRAHEPDSERYEDGVLVLRIERVTDEIHYEHLYFDGMEIRSTWNDGIRTEEIYYIDGKEVKRKSL